MARPRPKRINLALQGGGSHGAYAWGVLDQFLADGRIQIEGIDPVRALEQTLEQWREILAVRSRLSREAEVGLLGELSLLEALVSVEGPDAASSWRGASTP